MQAERLGRFPLALWPRPGCRSARSRRCRTRCRSPGPISRAKYSGLTVPPPWKLKPCSAGMSSVNGAPSAAQTSSGNPISRPSATGQTFGRRSRSLPAGARRRGSRHRCRSGRRRTRPAPRCTRDRSPAPGTLMPRLDRNTRSPMCSAWRGAGSVCSSVYQNSSCSSTGNVAQRLDIEGGDLGQQPVASTAGRCRSACRGWSPARRRPRRPSAC